MDCSWLYARVVAETENLVISHCTSKKCTKMRAPRAARLFFHLSTNDILVLWRCCYRSRRRCLNSLLAHITQCPNKRFCPSNLSFSVRLDGQRQCKDKAFIPHGLQNGRRVIKVNWLEKLPNSSSCCWTKAIYRFFIIPFCSSTCICTLHHCHSCLQRLAANLL